MTRGDRKNHAGTDPETQRQEISRRGHAPHPAGQGPFGLGTTTKIDPNAAPRSDEETPRTPPPPPAKK
jgi:hypothetical protein